MYSKVNTQTQRPRLLFVCIFENKIKKYVIIFEEILILVIEIETSVITFFSKMWGNSVKVRMDLWSS